MAGEPAAIRFENARLIDGTGAPVLERGALLVRDGRIAAVGGVDEVRDRSEGAGARAVDLAGLTLMPGLIDVHVHLIYWRYRSLQELGSESLEASTIKSLKNAEKLLQAGYTSVRDCGCRGNIAVAVRDAVNAGLFPGPRIVASGRIISATGGLADPFPDWWQNDYPQGVVCDGVDEIVREVRRQIKNRVDNVKLAASGAEILPYARSWDTTMTLEEVSAAVRIAHGYRKTVAIHAQAYEAARIAVQAGADTLEHGTRLDDETVALLAGGATIYVPTLCTVYSYIEKGAEVGVLPEVIQECIDNEALWLESLRKAKAAGARIAAGGDVGNRYPQGSNARELEFLVRNGFSPLEAIVAATKTAAEAIRLESKVGTLQAGKLADLLVVDGDPLADISVLQDHSRLAGVFQDGAQVAGRESLT